MKKKLLATILLATALVGTSASAAFAKNGADDARTGRRDCRHHETVCVVR
jgi:hypothetical protein